MNTPKSVSAGALDWMGVAHMLAVPGAEPTLAGLGGAEPLLGPRDVVLFGYSHDRATAGERRLVAELGIEAIPQAEVAADPLAAADRALRLTAGRGPVLVHFDTDSVDFAELPLAEDTARNVGLSFDAVAGALERILAGVELGALTITELNPHHWEPDGTTIDRLLDRLVPALAGAVG
jgi:arginase